MNTAREWGKPGPLLGAWLSIPDPFVAEVIAAQGFDYVCVDTQHGLIDFAAMVNMVRAIAARGSLPLVRVTENNPAEIMRALDIGARGIVVPLVNTAEEAARAAEACRYPPRGNRSFGPTRARLAQGPALADLERVACIVQVETLEGFQNAAAIAGTTGVAGIYIGPSDLALAFNGDPAHPACHEAVRNEIETIRDVCRDAGIDVGIHCLNGSMAAEYVDRDFSLVTVLVDAVHLARTAGAELNSARRASP